MASEISVLVTKEVPAPTFIKVKHELDKVIKSLETASKKAVEILVQGMEDTDPRVRMQCAEKVIAFLSSTTKQRNDEQLQRAIAEYRFAASQPKTLTVEEKLKQNTPIVNFNDIIEP